MLTILTSENWLSAIISNLKGADMINVAIVVRNWWGGRRIYRLLHPSKWAEVTAGQMMAYATIMGGAVNEERIMSAFLGVKRSVVRRLDPFHRYTLGKCLAFVNKDEPLAHFIVPELGGRKAPKQALQDVSFAEFIYMDTYYMDYVSGASENALDLLVSCVYRRLNGADRLKFSEDLDVEWVKRLKPGERFMVLKNYGMIRMWLETSYPEVFAKHKDDQSDVSVRQKPAKNGWIDVFDSIVGDDYANSDKYAERPAVEILRRLNSRIKQQKKQLRDAQATKSKRRSK